MGGVDVLLAGRAGAPTVAKDPKRLRHRRVVAVALDVVGRLVVRNPSEVTRQPPRGDPALRIIEVDPVGGERSVEIDFVLLSQARQSGALSNKPLPTVETRVVYLTRKIQLADGPKDDMRLIMTDGEKRTQIPMNFERLIVFCDMLKTIVAGSEWNLKLAYPWETVAQDKPRAAAASKASDDSPTQH